MKQMGQVNLGGLAREKYGDTEVALVGFGTYQGSVIASNAWDGPTRILTVPFGRSESVESECHKISTKVHAPQFFMLFDETSKEGPLSEVRGHRAIGVIYDPNHESRGNYVPTSLARRYDAFIFFDKTRALQPLAFHVDRNLIPETWPAGW